ncbi:MAG: T9SS type A sorting domain-containing protein [Bacteroidetes bacterium]|nr:T9SS type A sorting domain-containing protein [Bacteroidota bacterium]
MKKNIILSSLLAVTFLGVVGFCLITNSSGQFRIYFPSRIPFTYQLNTSTLPEFIPTIEASAEQWNNVEASYFIFQRGENTSVSSVANDGINLVYFDMAGSNFSDPNVIAFSSTFTTTAGGYQAIGSDLVWNGRDFTPGLKGELNKIDLLSVMTHEFGHHTGIDHTGLPSGASSGCGPQNNRAVMWYAVSRGDTSRRYLHPEDIMAIASLYPSWILQGNFTQSSNGLPLKGSFLKFEGTYGSTIGPVHNPISTRWNKAGFLLTEVPIDSTGTYATAVVNRTFTATAYKFGYFPKSQVISFAPPGGIGSTESLIFDAALEKKPLVNLSGNILDAVSLNGISAKMKFNWVGDTTSLGNITTGTTGAFTFTVPGDEYYKLRIDLEPPYRRFIILDSIYVSLTGKTLDISTKPVSVFLVLNDTLKTNQDRYINSLENSGNPFAVWDATAKGSIPSSTLLNSFTKPLTLVWVAGGESTSGLPVLDRATLIDYLHSGGRLILAGKNIAEYTDTADVFLSQYAGIKFNSNNSSFSSRGFPGDIIGSGLSLPMAGPGKDQLEISWAAKGNIFKVFHYGTGTADTVRIGAVRSEHSVTKWKVVFFGVGLEMMSEVNRDTVLTRSLRYTLDPNVATSIGDGYSISNLPLKYSISQNYPNPFNPETIIKFAVPEHSFVTIKIYDMLGKEIRTLVSDNKQAGYFDVNWNGKDNKGMKVSSGTYIYRITAKSEKSGKEFVDSKKMTLIK